MATLGAALAIGAHPDDVEFGMAGTLSLLAQAGFTPHIMNLGNGSCGTAQYSERDIIRIRGKEGAAAARLLGAQYHPGLVNDLMIYYEDRLVRRMTAIIRQVKPVIVLLPSLQDYMEDHTITGRVVVTACFCRGMRNYFSIPRVKPTGHDMCLYHAQPHMHMDGMRNPIIPSLIVDIGSEIALKEDMLRQHDSQKHWLDVSQGQDSYLKTMKDLCARVPRLAGVKGVKYAEGWRQHSWIGFSAEDRDILSEVLGKRVKKVK